MNGLVVCIGIKHVFLVFVFYLLHKQLKLTAQSTMPRTPSPDPAPLQGLFSPHFLPQTPSLGPSPHNFPWPPLRIETKMRKSLLKAGGPLRRLVLPRSDSLVSLGAWCCCEGVGGHPVPQPKTPPPLVSPFLQ